MKQRRSTAVTFLGTICLSILSTALMPALSNAQGRPGGGPAGVAGAAQQIQEVLKQLDLTPDEKTKIDDIIKKAQTDIREAMQDLRDADPADRRQKMQDIQKMMVDTKNKVADELTPEQKTKFYMLTSQAAVKRSIETMTTLQTAAGKMDVSEEMHTQMKPIFEDGLKDLDADKTEADAVKDADTAKDLQDKVTKTMTDTTRSLAQILGAEDTRKLMQSARPQGGPAGRRGAGGGGGGANGQDAPTTAPAPK